MTPFETAQKIADAINKKFPKYTSYVREIKSGVDYIEIAMRPPNGSHNDEIVVAYSCQWFDGLEGDALREKAMTILKQFKILMGLPT